VNCGTRRLARDVMLATVLERYTVPKIAKGLSLSTRRMTATEVGIGWVSCTDVSSTSRGMPLLVDVLDGDGPPSRHRADAGATARDLADIGSLITPGGRRRDGHQSHQRRGEGCTVRTVRMGTFSLTRCPTALSRGRPPSTAGRRDVSSRSRTRRRSRPAPVSPQNHRAISFPTRRPASLPGGLEVEG